MPELRQALQTNGSDQHPEGNASDEESIIAWESSARNRKNSANMWVGKGVRSILVEAVLTHCPTV